MSAQSETAIDPATLPEWGDKAWEEMDCDEFVDKLAAKTEGEEAQLTMEQMNRIEELWRESMPARRCVLIQLTRPFSELRDGIVKDRDLAKSVAEVYFEAEKLAQIYEGLSKLIRTSERWMMVALSHREDMHEVLAEAKAEAGEEEETTE